MNMDTPWAYSSEIPVEHSQGADVTVISLLMFLSPDCRCLFHWPLCPAGFPHCRLSWKPFLGSNPSHPGASLCQTTAVLLSHLQENQDLVLLLALMSLVSRNCSELCVDSLPALRSEDHLFITKTNPLSPGFQKQDCRIAPEERFSPA